MDNKEKYTKKAKSNIDNYKNKMADLDKIMKSYKPHNKAHLESASQNLKEKYKEAEAIYKKLQSSSQENFEDIKESSAQIFDALKEAFSDFSHLLTIDQLYHTKDEIVDYGNEKVSDVQEYIKKNPLTCAGIALGAGFIIGLICKRSK
jgi:ElaB/YqjD/DUF883 family membrane-anchored ribosome-binding protein